MNPKIRDLAMTFLSTKDIPSLKVLGSDLEDNDEQLKKLKLLPLKHSEDGCEVKHPQVFRGYIQTLFPYSEAHFVQYITDNTNRSRIGATREGKELEEVFKGIDKTIQKLGYGAKEYLINHNQNIEITELSRDELQERLRLTHYELELLMRFYKTDYNQIFISKDDMLVLASNPVIWCRLWSYEHKCLKEPKPKKKRASRYVPKEKGNNVYLKPEMLSDGQYEGRVISNPFATKKNTIQNVKIELTNGDIAMMTYPTDKAFKSKLNMFSTLGARLVFNIENGKVKSVYIPKIKYTANIL